MAVLIVEGRTRQFVTTDGEVRLCYVTGLATGKHRQIVNIKLSDLADSLGKYPCVTLLGYCIFGEEDCTSSFKGNGKVRPPKKLEKNPRFHNAFRQIGDDWKVKHRVMKQLEQFEYLVYGHISKSFVNAVHVKLSHKMVGKNNKLISKSRVDLSRRPCTSLLCSHTCSM